MRTDATKYEPAHLKRWTSIDPATDGRGNYAGVYWPDWYVAGFRHRDSDLLTESNFECVLVRLGGEQPNRVQIIRQGHWAVGWTEYLLVHEDAADALAEADRIADDYPVVDEDDYSRREYEAAQEDWVSFGRDDMASYLDGESDDGDLELCRDAWIDKYLEGGGRDGHALDAAEVVAAARRILEPGGEKH